MCARPSNSQSLFDLDDQLMARALKLARRGEGHVEPNPMVGCVIARRDRVLGEGYHRRFGGHHAEVEALSKCTDRVRGATAYVSLEPCCHQGKTPPCCDALIDSGIKRVVVATRDPNPLVRGKGLYRLRASGIQVDVGVCEKQAKQLLAPYLTLTKLGRPYVIAKWAQSLDGKLATRTGDSQWISCKHSRRTVHRLRARVDGILVGSNTVIRDDPRLTARDVPLRRTALRIVLDSRLRIPEGCRLVKTCNKFPTVIFTTQKQAASAKADRLRHLGCEVRTCRLSRSSRVSSSKVPHLDLTHVLQLLAHQDVTNLLVEGGPSVLSSFLAQQLVDEAMVFTAPILIGGHDAPGPLVGDGCSLIRHAVVPASVTTKRSGIDTLHHLRFAEKL